MASDLGLPHASSTRLNSDPGLNKPMSPGTKTTAKKSPWPDPQIAPYPRQSKPDAVEIAYSYPVIDTLDGLKQYLDQAITRWRDSESPLKDAYVDAYQSVRMSVFDELLPVVQSKPNGGTPATLDTSVENSSTPM